MSSASDIFGLDFGDKTAEQVEKDIGKIPEGWYRGKLVHAEVDPDKGNLVLKWDIDHRAVVVEEGKGKEKKYLVCAVPPNAKQIVDRITMPGLMDERSGDKYTRAVQRMQMVCVRLGAVDREAKGKVTPDFQRCVGRDYVINVENNEFNGFVSFRPKYSAIYPPTHHDLKNDIVQPLGFPAIPTIPGMPTGNLPPADGSAGSNVPATPATAQSGGGASAADVYAKMFGGKK